MESDILAAEKSNYQLPPNCDHGMAHPAVDSFLGRDITTAAASHEHSAHLSREKTLVSPMQLAAHLVWWKHLNSWIYVCVCLIFLKAVSWSGHCADQLSWTRAHSVSLKGFCGWSDASGMGNKQEGRVCASYDMRFGVLKLWVYKKWKWWRLESKFFFLSPLLEKIYPVKLQWTESVWIIKRIMTQTTSTLYSCTYNHCFGSKARVLRVFQMLTMVVQLIQNSRLLEYVSQTVSNPEKL